ncbi:Gfo/Idh/MocA family protein [Microbacterium sp. B2969]|uniref:Gfo/Idh/MocA family protein n=1 Tax=Microbacterium alkaliflavum TaxID=3248839 RepID=A0ABW7Q9B4_9MICO
MSRPRVALVGAGSMGRNHARVIAESARADLAVVVDPFEGAGRELADRFDAAWRPELGSLSDVDAVVVAASTEHHYTLATEIIREGKPLLVEKPVCPSLAQSEEIIALSAAADVPLMCGFLERFNPAIMVGRGMIEDPVYIRAERHSPYAPRIKTGVAWDLLVHDVDLITLILGAEDPVSVNVEVGQFHPSSVPGAEDVIEVSLGFASGTVASASASRVGQRKIRSMTVQSLHEMIEIDLLRRGVTVFRRSEIQEDRPGGAGYRQITEMEVPEITGREPLASQLDHFIDMINGDVDSAAERESILPAHRIVDNALQRRGQQDG